MIARILDVFGFRAPQAFEKADGRDSPYHARKPRPPFFDPVVIDYTHGVFVAAGIRPCDSSVVSDIGVAARLAAALMPRQPAYCNSAVAAGITVEAPQRSNCEIRLDLPNQSSPISGRELASRAEPGANQALAAS
jgi:hypothetical protein